MSREHDTLLCGCGRIMWAVCELWPRQANQAGEASRTDLTRHSSAGQIFIFHQHDDGHVSTASRNGTDQGLFFG